jgi:hypothetical protein
MMEIRAGVLKVIYGTTIGAVALSFFPFAQETSRAWFDFLTTERTAEAAQRVSDQGFLESLKLEARSKNLDERIILAEFYANIPTDQASRDRWQVFLKMLVAQREAARSADIEKTKTSLPDANEEEIAAAVAAKRADQLQESAAAGGAISVAVPSSFQGLLQQLESPDTSVRRNARSALALLGLQLVRPAMAELLAPDTSYRVRLGLIVAVTEMMRNYKQQRNAAILQIDDQALAELLRLATDPDNTIRIYAGEFLYDLGDPRGFNLVPAVWENTNSDNGRFNLALALKGAAPFLGRDQSATARSLLSGYLGTVGPRTDELLRDALRLLP